MMVEELTLNYAGVESNLEHRELLKRLFVRDKDGSDSLFIDQGVYTRNRNFRIILSSKLGKGTPLVDTSMTELTFERFKQTLVCNSVYSERINLIYLIDSAGGNTENSPPNDKRNNQMHFEKIETSSPWSGIDQFLLGKLSLLLSGRIAFIRSCVYFEQCNSYDNGSENHRIFNWKPSILQSNKKGA